MDKNISPDSKSNQLAQLLNENRGEKWHKNEQCASQAYVDGHLSPLCKVQIVSFHLKRKYMLFHLKIPSLLVFQIFTNFERLNYYVWIQTIYHLN